MDGRRFRRSAALASLGFAVACGSATHLTPRGDLWISGRVLVFEHELPNLALVRLEPAGPTVGISRDAAGRWVAAVAVRNFGLGKTAAPAEVDVFVDGRPAGSWTIRAPIRSGVTVRNLSIPIGGFAAGAHEVRVAIDPSNRVEESMKSDNEYRTTFTVPPADAVLAAVFPSGNGRSSDRAGDPPR
ncbi:MAG TPA: CARDB domain-containing protein [Thermoanaerobaculia bacterium]|nr:CARDB domain-containing protein [Thermoanaerobaculia bacterium]